METVHATPDFVPHKEWENYWWLLPPQEKNNEPWYYAAHRENPPQTREVPTNPEFIKTVDLKIQPLVLWFHQHGIPTGPSCAGHNISESEFKKIYQKLKEEESLIQNNGLYLLDPETGTQKLMYDNSYFLPWESFENFYNKAKVHQLIGWLSFYTTDPRVQLLLSKHPHFSIQQIGPDSYGICTSGKNKHTWDQVLRNIQKVFS